MWKAKKEKYHAIFIDNNSTIVNKLLKNNTHECIKVILILEQTNY